MKLRNSSAWPDPFIRRMLVWCIREVDVPRMPAAAGKRRQVLRSATFRTRTTRTYSGHASDTGDIVVSVNPDPTRYPVRHAGYKRACRPADGSDYPILADPLETLVIVTAHELGHVAHFRHGFYGRGQEDRADARARFALRRFRERRAELEADWTAAAADDVDARPARATAAKPTVQERRAAKAQAMLDLWARKLALAKTKAAKYRKRVAYYERRAATSAIA